MALGWRSPRRSSTCHCLALIAAGATVSLLLMMFAAGDSYATEDAVVASASLEGLSTSEVYEQLKLALSPANQRASCQSVIYPGGKCSCVDATPFDGDNCFLVPVFDGKKTVCLDALPPGRPCLVYSFGIRDDISFETEMVKLSKGVVSRDACAGSGGGGW